MKKIVNALKTFWRKMPKWLLAILIAVAVGLIFKSVVVGALTLVGIVAALTIFVFGRQAWWWLTSTGDSQNRNRKIIIRKGRHYPFPGFFVWLPKWVKSRTSSFTKMDRSYYFTESCLYDLEDEDQLDVNKLYGFSIGNHHTNSFRFGWRPNKTKDKIEIIAYEYLNKDRFIETICEIDINTWIKFGISYSCLGTVKYSVNNTLKVHSLPVLKKSIGLGYKLGFYFGGNKTAPHKIKVLKLLKPIISLKK